MKIKNTRRWFIGALLSLAASGAATITSIPAIAHEANCPYCTLPVVQDTKTQDNEVALKYGRKRIEYRCVFCALSEAQSEYKGDLSILAPSEEKSAPVTLTRKAGKWTAEPKNAVFVAQKANHRVCQITYRAFSNRAAFDAYVKKHAEHFDKDVKPLTLNQMLEASK